MTIEMSNYFDPSNNVSILGYIDPIQVFDTAPFCQILNDQYLTPSNLFNSNGTREEYPLVGSFRGFNLTYSLNITGSSSSPFSLSNPLSLSVDVYSSRRQNILATAQKTSSSGSSVLARLSMTRMPQGERFYVWVAH